MSKGLTSAPVSKLRIASSVAIAASCTWAGASALAPGAASGLTPAACPAATALGGSVYQVTATATCLLTVPTSVTALDVLAVGGGGGGAGASGYAASGGGGGGQVLLCTAAAVSPADAVILSIGGGGTGGTGVFESINQTPQVANNGAPGTATTVTDGTTTLCTAAPGQGGTYGYEALQTASQNQGSWAAGGTSGGGNAGGAGYGVGPSYGTTGDIIVDSYASSQYDTSTGAGGGGQGSVGGDGSVTTAGVGGAGGDGSATPAGLFSGFSTPFGGGGGGGSDFCASTVASTGLGGVGGGGNGNSSSSRPTDGTANTGGGGGGGGTSAQSSSFCAPLDGGAGGSGVVLIRYLVPIATVTTTQVSTTSFTLGGGITDAATVTASAGSAAPTGTVAFSYCYSATTSISTCTSGATSLSSAALTAGTSTASTASTSLTPNAAGYYVMHASYSGSSPFVASADAGTNESFQVLAPPATTTTTTTTTTIPATPPKAIPHVSSGQINTPQTFKPLVGDKASSGATLPSTVRLCAGSDRAPNCTHTVFKDAAGSYRVAGKSVIFTPTHNYTGTDTHGPRYSFTDTAGKRASAHLTPTVKGSAVKQATTPHTGEPWGGSGLWTELVALFGAALIVTGEMLRRRRRA